jgi:predicted site-specific integrase-resolvase
MTDTSQDSISESFSDLYPAELGNEAGCRKQMIYNYIRAGRLPAYRDQDGRLSIRRADADVFLAARAAKAERKQDEIERQLAWRKKHT